jgi:hypothetical protein
LPAQSKVYEYIKRHQELKIKKDFPSVSKNDACDVNVTFSAPMRRAASSMSMGDVSQHVTVSGSRSIQGTTSIMSQESKNIKTNRNRFDIFSPDTKTKSPISSKDEGTFCGFIKQKFFCNLWFAIFLSVFYFNASFMYFKILLTL